MSMLRDPMSKTLAAALCGILALAILGIVVAVGAIVKGGALDGATVGLLGTIVSGITACVMAVSSRAQARTPSTDGAST